MVFLPIRIPIVILEEFKKYSKNTGVSLKRLFHNGLLQFDFDISDIKNTDARFSDVEKIEKKLWNLQINDDTYDILKNVVNRTKLTKTQIALKIIDVYLNS